MIKVSDNIEAYKVDLEELIKLYTTTDVISIELTKEQNNNLLRIQVQDKVYNFKEQAILTNDKLIYDRVTKKFIKNNLYKCLKQYYHKSLAWGSLTGVRPAKIVYDYMKENQSLQNSINLLKKEYLVSKSKSELLFETIKNQISVTNHDSSICLYIHIPICPSRCVYCSFVATDFKNAYKYIDDYCSYLEKELIYTLEQIKRKQIKINSIYVGGGTPTIFNEKQLEQVLRHLNVYKGIEFTVECGRADTITRTKLQTLQNCGVNRISINPQTFNDNVLKTIGRNHTTKDVVQAFRLAREFNFDINMDLIAGLPGDTLKSFKQSIIKTIELNPENVTVHTLSIKNAGLLKFMNNAKLPAFKTVKTMLNFSNSKLKENNYNPYYLYRQKNMLGFLENVGYAKKSKFCIFNINSMEELKPIVACGAGAISKKFHYGTGKVERIANVKQISDYISRFNEMITRKDYFFSQE